MARKMEARLTNYIDLVKAGINNERALQLQKISRQLHHLDECACNQGLSQRQETRVFNLIKTAAAIAQEHSLYAYHQRDPRGWPLYLVKGEGEDYTQGIAVCPH